MCVYSGSILRSALQAQEILAENLAEAAVFGPGLHSLHIEQRAISAAEPESHIET